MKTLYLSLMVLVATSAFGIPAKKFQRVLVLSGGGFQFAQFLGILDGLKAAHGWEPDLVITTCGASYAGMLINGMSDPKDRLDFLKAKPFHDELLKIKTREKLVVGLAFSTNAAAIVMRSLSDKPTLPIPQVFGGMTLLDVPQEFPSEVTARKFSDKGIRLLVVGSKLNFGPNDVGKPDLLGSNKLYTEAYATDEDLAGDLVGRKSSIAEAFPESAVDETTEVYSDRSLGQAARMSISDLMYLEPAKHGDTYFGGGFVNLYPLELALDLGEEVVMLRSLPFDAAEQAVIKATMGYDGNVRREKLNRLGGARVKWVKMQGQDKMYENHGFNPKVERKGLFEPWMTTRVPVDPEAYASQVQAQYDWGHEAAKNSW